MSSADRPILVFAHYFGGSARSWEPLLKALGGGDHVARDLPGFGGSEPPADPSLEAYADHVASLAGGLRNVYEARPAADIPDAFADILLRIEAAERALR